MVVLTKYVIPPTHGGSPVSSHPPCLPLLPPVEAHWYYVSNLVLQDLGDHGVFHAVLAPVAWLCQAGIFILN